MGLVIGLEHKGRPYKMCDSVRQKLNHTKGQLISECLFEKIVWTKIPTKNLIDSAQQV